ncbi:TolC family protein [Burkholderia mallei]|nr:TolC family protein [Burkholderia mallei]WPJ35606.1 TolC family protein [Burkholderia mallei]WPJ39987.1 TolC family protein [Burkholderia mallei]WPJ44866.1 TolC family protein [Burkholderia mallei]
MRPADRAAAQRPVLPARRRAGRARRRAARAARAAGASADGADRAAVDARAPPPGHPSRGSATARGDRRRRRGCRAVLPGRLADGPGRHARELAHWSHLFYAFGPSVSLPIFEGGALVANLRLSQAQQAQAALGYRRAVLLALRDVDNALAAYRTDQTRRDALRDAAAAERTTFELARDSYRHGLVSFIDVLDAERELSQARQQYVQGSLQLTTDLVSLYKALGGGWQPVPAAQTPAPAALDAPTQDTPLGATAPARR